MSRSRGTDSVARRLSAVFRRSGYVRRQSSRRLAAEGYRRYKKGDEIRFIATSRSELATVRRLLRRAGFQPGRPFPKGRRFAQPVYGRAAVQQLLSLLITTTTPNKRAAANRRSAARARAGRVGYRHKPEKKCVQ